MVTILVVWTRHLDVDLEEWTGTPNTEDPAYGS